jgi:hypothetical protein
VVVGRSRLDSIIFWFSKIAGLIELITDNMNIVIGLNSTEIC